MLVNQGLTSSGIEMCQHGKKWWMKRKVAKSLNCLLSKQREQKAQKYID
jgi:hypothetical protein